MIYAILLFMFTVIGYLIYWVIKPRDTDGYWIPDPDYKRKMQKRRDGH